MNYIPKYFTIALAIILISINILYYFSIQGNLVKNQEEKIELILHNIKGSIQENHDIEDSFNHYLAEDLRLTAIAIQSQLPPDAEDVTTEQLAELEERYRLKGVTLFVPIDDDIVSVVSSNEGEVGLSAKKLLSSDWHSMLRQLLIHHNVRTIDGFGHALKNFWAAPVAQSKSNPEMVTKWGYYQDGSTNYIISVFVERHLLDAYYETAGLEKKLKHITDINKYVLNISVVNGTALQNGLTQEEIAKGISPNDALFLGGKNRFPTPKDEKLAVEALESDEMIHYKADSNDKAVLKSYFPAELIKRGTATDELLIVVTSDFDLVNSELLNRIWKNLTYSTIIFLIGLTTILVSVRAINRRERTISNVQSLYKQHIDSIFETMREHRHDFNHHLHTISGLAKMGLTADLHAYVGNLVKVHDEFITIVDASIPALSGLVQSKTIEAREKEINFEHHFENMENLDIPVEKITDVVSIIGNILDNGFHAVDECGKRQKNVSIYGRYSKGILKFSISNNGPKISDDVMSQIFKLGFTTRSTVGGTGIGLASSKKAMERYKGDITVVSDDDTTTFTVTVPLDKKEIRLHKCSNKILDYPAN